MVGKVFGLRQGDVHDGMSNRTVAAWDSLGHVTLVLELEAAYGVALSTSDALEMTDVAAIKRVLQKRGVEWAR
ncbi:MAG: acyl carrier protein [Methanobacteriota archaeon]|nr:MAG: acyl carrier protein [Euryarchaeota archaeon]